VSRKLVFVLAVATASATMGTGGASAQTDTTFCNAALAVDRALAALGDEPKATAVDRVRSALTPLEATAPPELTSDVAALVGAIGAALDDGDNPTTEPTFAEDVAAVNAYRFASCGYQTADVTLLEYEFTGLPKTFQPGVVALRVTNTGTEVHELALARLRTTERFRKSLGRDEDDQRSKLRYVAQTLVEPDETDYLFVTVKAGRYGAACHIPIGTQSVDDLGSESEHGGHGDEAAPHWEEGMLSTFRVS
jgi:hypothetical protein